MYDVSSSWNVTSGGAKAGFIGTVLCDRGSSGATNITAEINISCAIAYNGKTGRKISYSSDFGNDVNVLPCCIKYVDGSTTKYYLALELRGSDFTAYMNGRFWGTWVGTQINSTDSSGTMPSGYSIDTSWSHGGYVASSDSSTSATRATQRFDRFISYCSTTASTPAKIASCDNYALRTGDVFVLVNTVTNTYTGAITLNVNSKGAKAVYLNGVASSSSNYNLTAGTYLVYYDGTRYYINTDGSYPAPVKDSNPIGTIIAFAGSVPTGYLLCNGQAVSRTTYADLYAVIGTKYGAGNGSTTFNVPNLVEKFPMGANGTLGTSGGDSRHLHLAGNLGAAIGACNDNATLLGYDADLNDLSPSVFKNPTYVLQLGNTTGFRNWNHGTKVYGNTDYASSLPPYQTVNYCIKALNASGGISTNATLNDSIVSSNTLWSSNKIDSLISTLNTLIDNLSKSKTGFPDYGRKIKEIGGTFTSWVATEDCYIARNVCSASAGGDIYPMYINDNVVGKYDSSGSSLYTNPFFAYAKKGDKISGTYMFIFGLR